MRYVELFAGVGGFRLGIERVIPSAEGVFANEWDKYAAQTYDKNFGGSIDQRDIRTVTGVPDHDLLVGGFPCQAFSVAGKRGGFNETRGTLFFEIARILADKKPQHLLLENVKGLLSHDGGTTFQTILRVLADLGYRVEWQVLNSRDFGVPQNRERVLIVGHLGGQPRPEVFPLGRDGIKIDVVSSDDSNGTQAIATRHLGRNGKLISDIAPAIQATETPHVIYAVKKDHGELVPTRDEALTLDANYHKGFDNHGQRTGILQLNHAADAFRVYDPAGLGRTLKSESGGTGGKMGLYKIGARVRKLTPVECERLQGFPDNWTAGVSDSQRYKQMGNAVTVNVIEAVIRKLYG